MHANKKLGGGAGGRGGVGAPPPHVPELFWAADAIAQTTLPIALSVCRVLYCGQTVPDGPIVCIEVE